MFKKSIVELLQWRGLQQPEQMAYAFLREGKTIEKSWTYGELNRRAIALSVFLNSQIQPGDRVLLLYPTGLEFLAAFFGCLYAGIIAVPAPPPEVFGRQRVLTRLSAIAIDAQPSLILTTAQILPQVEKICDGIPALAKIQKIATDTLNLEMGNDWIEPKVNSGSVAYLQYTSGSTSTPKGVIITQDCVVFNLKDATTTLNYNSDSIIANWMPHFHDAGLVGGLLRPLYMGLPCYILSPLALMKQPIRWLETISRYRVTHCIGTNFIYDYCASQIQPEQCQNLDLSCWQMAGVGAEPVRLETIDRFAEKFKPYGFSRRAFCPGYGLAEATLTLTATRTSDLPSFVKLGAKELRQNQVWATSGTEATAIAGCGYPFDDTQVAIVNPETLMRCGVDEIGEIWVSSPSIAQGYWQRPDATEQTFQAYLADSEEGPFLRTGDLGFIKDGELFVTGRLKDLIIIRGQNYYPQDIEWTVEKSHPALRDNCCAIFSVEIEGLEQLVIAAEVERGAIKNLDIDEVLRSIRSSVAEHHELPVYGVVLLKTGTIPKTSSGKIQRHACRAGFLEGSLDSIANWTLKTATTEEYAVPQSEYEFRLMQIWQKVLGLKDIGIQDNFFEWGGDSLKAAEVLAQVEVKFGQNLPLSALLENPTIAQFARCLSQPEWADDERSLVAIKPQGKKRPFFYVHPRSGSILLAANLARYIDADRPFYGLQSVGLNGKQQPYDRIEDMAAHYIREIQTVQPKGPYLLGGRCIGGVIALEMAQQLLESGEKVLLLAIVETPRTGIVDEVLAQQIQENMSKMRQLSQRQANNFQAVMNANDEAGKHYQPKFYPGQIAYFAAENTIHNPTSGFGWAELAGGGLEIVQVPGNHISVTEEPHVGVFAQKLSHCLDEGERRGVSSRLQEVKEDLARSKSRLSQIMTQFNLSQSSQE